MKIGVLATIVFTISIGLPIASFAGLAPDSDGDGVPDVLDNCSAVSNAGTLDCDTDQDGYGNRCDCDLTDSAGCTSADLALWKIAFKGSPQTNLNANHDCSAGATPITSADLALWKLLFKNSGTQFKSGLSCANPNAANSCPN
jgi:hypothetical protein